MLGHRRLVHFPKELYSVPVLFEIYLQIHGDIAGMLNKLIGRTRIDEGANMLGDRVNIQKRSGQARTMD